uniref:Transposase domain-containing protein n=2 Tax=Anopheles arabiensis TaxID=7173 RepID=A0A182HLU9_ANOAR
ASLTADETLPESVPQESQESDESIPVDAHEADEESDDKADSFNEDDPFSDINDDSDWSDDEGLNIRNVQFQEKLRHWALSSNISHYAVGSLLSLLKEETKFKLPKDPRTLLKTPTATSIDIKNIAGGQFWYNGVANCLKSYFTTMQPGPSTLWLDFSMDGLPIHNSGPTQLWPILMRVTDLPQAPVFVVALFCGKTKPASAEDYLRQLVAELNRLQSAGVTLGGKKVTIRVRAIIADTPARAFIKGAIAHTGYDSCLKCTEHTVYDRSTHRMHFSGVDAPKRTAKNFKAG